MKLRELRRADAARFFGLLKDQFPEEERIYGMRPEGVEAVLRRLYRPDLRLLLGLLRAVHRSPFHLYVIEEAGAIAAVTQLSFAARAGYLSTVVVAPEFRRRGFARQLLAAAQREAARRGKPYVALRVLASNAPARALYESVGYRELDREMVAVHEAPVTFGKVLSREAIRPFRRSDAEALAEVSNRSRPETVREVLPLRGRDLLSGRWADRVFSAETAAWVIDRGRGPEAHVSATSIPATEAAHLGSPIVGESVEPELAADLVRTAGAWLESRRPARIVTSVPEGNPRSHRALEETGFHDALPTFTLYRSSR